MVTKSVKKSWLKSAKKKTNSNVKPKASQTSRTTTQMLMASQVKAVHRL